MENDANELPTNLGNTGSDQASSTNSGHSFSDPVTAYTANGNIEAHSAVTWLESNGIRSYAVEDNSGASLFAFGTISQFHKPQVFVERSHLERAKELLQQFERQRHERRKDLENADPVTSECEDCGESSEFPASQDGTTQNCPKCGAYMDVGSFDWPEDYDAVEEELEPHVPDNVEDAIDAAALRDSEGDWDEAIAAYQQVANLWPEHKTYAENCIVEIRAKIEAAK